MAMVGLLGALPNTRLYRRLQREGRLKQGALWNGNNTHEMRMSFTPVLPEEILVSGYKRILSTIYDPKNYFERCYTFIRRLPSGGTKAPFRIRYNELHALFLSLFRQTFSSYGHHYLKFLGKIIFGHLRHFPLAISFAVKGHHFFKMTKNIVKAEYFSLRLERAKAVLRERTIAAHLENAPAQKRRLLRLGRKLVHINRRIVKKYYRLNRDVRAYLDEQYNDFQKTFRRTISSIKIE